VICDVVGLALIGIVLEALVVPHALVAATDRITFPDDCVVWKLTDVPVADPMIDPPWIVQAYVAPEIGAIEALCVVDGQMLSGAVMTGVGQVEVPANWMLLGRGIPFDSA
jgi:hypothetical protein